MLEQTSRASLAARRSALPQLLLNGIYRLGEELRAGGSDTRQNLRVEPGQHEEDVLGRELITIAGSRRRCCHQVLEDATEQLERGCRIFHRNCARANFEFARPEKSLDAGPGQGGAGVSRGGWRPELCLPLGL